MQRGEYRMSSSISSTFFFFEKRSLTEHSEFCLVSSEQAPELCLSQFLPMLELQKIDMAFSFPNQELRQ